MLTVNNQQMMSTREIAELLGKSHSNIKVSAERMAANGTLAMQGSKFVHNGNEYTEYLLNERDSIVLAAQNCPEFTAKIVDRWRELEVKLINGNNTPSNNGAPISDQLALLESFAKVANIQGSALLGMYQSVQLNNNIPNLLPNYAIDSSEGESSMVTNSASELLKSHNAGISALKFNKLCIEFGFLEEKERKSTKGDKIRKYKAITDKGMIYGKNMTSPKNQAEVAPRWYESKFSELLVEIGVSE